MVTEIKSEDGKILLKFSESITIHNVSDTKSVLDKVEVEEGVKVDFTEVAEIDSAGFQLLYTFLRDLRRSGVMVEFIGLSEPIKNFCSTYNLEL